MYIIHVYYCILYMYFVYYTCILLDIIHVLQQPPEQIRIKDSDIFADQETRFPFLFDLIRSCRPFKAAHTFVYVTIT